MLCCLNLAADCVLSARRFGESERAVGEWLRRRVEADPSFRSKVVISTKFGTTVSPGANGRGASRAHILHEVQLSLQRLQTDYIDLYIQHCWDESTPIEETLLALNDLVRAGKVRYLGASNFTAAQLVRASHFSAQHGLSGFVSLQNQWSLLSREVEWEIAAVCRQEGVALMSWSPLAGGWLSGKYTRAGSEHREDATTRAAASEKLQWAALWSAARHANELTWSTVDVLHQLAVKHDVHESAVAIRWLLQKQGAGPVVIGPKTVEQLRQNLQAVSFELSAGDVQQLSDVSKLPLPYPYSVIAATNGRHS